MDCIARNTHNCGVELNGIKAMSRKIVLATGLATLVLHCTLAANAQPGAEAKKFPGAWTDRDDKTLPEDFTLQGEFTGEFKGGGKLGAQIIALGKSAFQAVLLPGGLPGDGWDGKQKILMDGKREGDKAHFVPTAGKRRYIAPKIEEFSATSKFPPPGQKNFSASLVGAGLTGVSEDGQAFVLKKTERKSPSQSLKPPPGAVVLFDGQSTTAFNRGRLDDKRGILHTDGADVVSKREFNHFTLHVEFMLPFRPDSRGQQRANSGLYLVNHYEMQILDSFGLDGKNNECGAIYQRVAPTVNMCLPPLQWQTFDIDFSNAVVDDKGNKTKNARLGARLNGVIIHDDVEIPGSTGLARKDPSEGKPGPLRLQGHNNPVQFRNIWIVEK
jgi:hypothetical protein